MSYLKSIETTRRWARYLVGKGHVIGEDPGMVFSQDSAGNRHLWVVLDCPVEAREFTCDELGHIRRLLKAAGKVKVYVVASFDGRFVAASAEHVLRAGRLDPDEGGIEW